MSSQRISAVKSNIQNLQEKTEKMGGSHTVEVDHESRQRADVAEAEKRRFEQECLRLKGEKARMETEQRMQTEQREGLERQRKIQLQSQRKQEEDERIRIHKELTASK